MPKKTITEKENELLKEIGKNINSYYEEFDINIRNYKIDRQFLFIDQWDAQDRQEFARLRKPLLTFNKIYDFYKKIIGEQRQNTPNLEVRCINGDASQKAISLRADIIRHIAYSSRSDIVYQTAFESAISGGFGGIRVLTEYESPKSFNQKIVIKRIDNPERLFFDLNSNELTKHDGEYCGYYDSMSKKEFKKKYPEVKYPKSFPTYIDNRNFYWGDEDNISIVEYYKKEWFTFTIHQLNDGRTVTDKEYKKIKEKYEEMLSMEDVGMINEPIMLPEIVNSRKSTDYKIMCYKAIYGEIIEKYEWPSQYFPLVFCPGDTHIVDGLERTLSFIRFVKDAQRFLNYCGSEIAQSIKNSRREQFLVTPSNITGEGLIDMWKDPSNQQGALVATPDPTTGFMPQKLPPSEVPQTLLVQYKNSEADIQSILGYFEANRGMQGQELSGVALRQRQRTGNLGVAVFFDNLDIAIEQVGRIILSLIPKIYDTERKMFKQSPDGSSMEIMVNQNIAGGVKENDLTEGEYDVAITSGPNFAVQQEEALKILVEMAKINPQTFPLVADLIAENIDIENNPQLVERFKTLVPQDILAKEKGLPPQPPQPDPNAIMQQQMQQQMLQFKQKELQLKEQQQQLDAQKALRQQQIDAAKAELEMEQLQMQKEITGMKANAEVGKAHLNYRSDVINALSNILNAQTNLKKTVAENI